MRFSIETPNIGDGDLALGPPEDNPIFEWSQCHNHYHYTGYAGYELLDESGKQAATGRKQAFCLVDARRYVTDDETVSSDARYNCASQGIQRGWSDIYESKVPCQYIDITDVPDGNYTLRVDINTDRGLPESDYSNNFMEIPVALGSADLTGPSEECPAVAPAIANSASRECGWDFAQSITCVPGQIMRVGCAQACNLGSCTGNPMLRICDSDRADGNCSYTGSLSRSNDACGSLCPRANNLVCPQSGSVDVYTAPSLPGQSYSCDLATTFLP